MREVVFLLSLMFSDPSSAVSQRSSSARTHFAHDTPCPGTHQNRLPCPGFVIDHKIPLCAGGLDAPVNMQWEEYAESKRKDKEEVYWCHLIGEHLMAPYQKGLSACSLIQGQDMPLLRRAVCP